MKLAKLFTAVLLFATVAMVSCKSKAAKELIANKWKLTGISGEGGSGISEAQKKDMIDKVVMELTKDGKCSMSGMGDTPKTGTYTLSEDGKTLLLLRDGHDKPDPQIINELTESKLVIIEDKSKMQMTWSAK